MQCFIMPKTVAGLWSDSARGWKLGGYKEITLSLFSGGKSSLFSFPLPLGLGCSLLQAPLPCSSGQQQLLHHSSRVTLVDHQPRRNVSKPFLKKQLTPFCKQSLLQNLTDKSNVLLEYICKFNFMISLYYKIIRYQQACSDKPKNLIRRTFECIYF